MRPMPSRPLFPAVLLSPVLIAALAGEVRAGDDFYDIVATDLDSLWVFRGDGEGGFQDPVQLYVADAVEPWAVAIGDLNDDARGDVVSANRYGPTATVFLNLGDGMFDGPLTIYTDQMPYDVDLGDIDGDGDLDVVITSNYDPGTVLLLYNDGAGAFPNSDSIVLDPGDQSFNSELVDLDGNGTLDLLVTLNKAKAVKSYLNAGGGVFALHAKVAAGNDPKAIKAADLNGDRFPDAVVANDSAGIVTVFLGDGAGGLRQKATYSAGVQPREIVLTDLDGDGVKDLVAAGGRGSSVVTRFIGQGDGTFAAGDDFYTGPRPNSLDAADFDLDGKVDLAVANWSLDTPSLATLSVLFGDGAGWFPEKIDLFPSGGTWRKLTAVAVGQLDQVRFTRGDTTGAGGVTITDAVKIFKYLFSSGKLDCLDAADVNDSGSITITDAVIILHYLFVSGPAPKAPFEKPGVDPTPDDLGCDR